MKNLSRWIFASAASHFAPVTASLSLPYFVEGVHERDDDTMKHSHVEMRVTGPNIKELSNGYYHVEAVINILLTSHMDMSGDGYDIIQWAGVFQDEMLPPIPIYKLGDGVDDDDSLVGCLRIKKNKEDSVKVYHFGQLSGVDRIRQSEVDGVYGMELTDSDV